MHAFSEILLQYSQPKSEIQLFLDNGCKHMCNVCGDESGRPFVSLTVNNNIDICLMCWAVITDKIATILSNIKQDDPGVSNA